MSVIRIGGCALLGGILIWLASPSALAEGGIKVWPTRIDMTIREGEHAAEVVNVRNEGLEPVKLRAYCQDFTYNDAGEIVFLEPGYESYSGSMWVTLGEDEWEMDGEEVVEVVLEVGVPAAIEPGGHYAAVFFETVHTAGDDGIAISTRIPCLLYMTADSVDGVEAFAEAHISDVILPGIVESGPVEVGVAVANSGNVHVTVAATGFVRDSWGTKSEIDLGQVTVLPNTERIMSGEWAGAPFLGRVTTEVVIGYYDQEGQLINREQSESFLVVPWKHLTGLVAGLSFLVLGARLLAGRYSLKIKRK